MIQFEQVSKRYPGGHDALKNLSFTIDSGEMLFLAGHSGAGKSTLLKLISGIERATSGNVLVNDQNLSRLRPSQLPYVRQHIGIVFQDHKILFDRSVFDNVMLPLDIIGFDRRDAARRVRAALDKVGLLGKEKVMPVRLSGGEQQRLCIARAVVHRPSILLADEPSANLDRAYALDIMELFKSFHQVGVTVIVSAHDETLMEDYGRRIIRLREGQFAS
ncbi:MULTISPECIES: cell division ATP-binding protein FtsE [Vogesella]|jgi:cell division transport system ATP-binding protein|uniref:Cell division ATP-binding protein FtsE n=1 Tax=Vogesella aquatica TaxID=2984206 RepID=A0ABT5IW38_9NEIS|nr:MULTISPECIES: cell division ATP-binding protein FtsE [Vogesella]MBP7580835.1 cell division ATP-binding protein FtsE [Vogesella sp.]MDC7716406.1 cell division ATP-binding protein FtsE [Vogesella aquatica]UDM15805.1 cell division ATP-binding protein FtsE [Vogesella sp. XCS3]